MKQNSTNIVKPGTGNPSASQSLQLIIKHALTNIMLMLFLLQVAKAQNGYLYVHAKSISQDLNQSFAFAVSGGSTSVPSFTLLDQALNIEPTDIGAGHGTGAGELWVVAGATQGASGSVYHRAANSTVWNAVAGQSGIAIDGADLGHFVIVTAAGDVNAYNGSSFTKIYSQSTYGAKAVDVANNGSITSGIGYTALVDENGHVWRYTGNYSSTFTWTDITPVDNSGMTFKHLDINATNNEVVLNDAGGYVSKINSNGTGLVYYGRTGSAPSQTGDITVDANGTMYDIQADAQGMDAAYRYNGTTWVEEPETGLHYFLTSSDAGQVWIIKGYTASQSSSFANQSTIYTRTGDGSGTWLDDERVQASQNDNAIMIPVVPGTYTISEASVSNWNLQNITIYDSVSGSTTNVAGKSASVVVKAGQVAHILFINGLVAPLAIPSGCGVSNILQNFGSGAANTKGGPLTGLTDFHYYSSNTTPDGYYSVTQTSIHWGNNTLTDHTGLTGGYFLMVNASYAPNEFYRQRVSGLVLGANYVLSFWAANLSPSDPRQPNILAGIITDTLSGTILGSVSTGSLPTDNSWHQYRFSFTATATTGDLFLQNNALGGYGNDLAIDDIAISQTCSILPQTVINFNAQKQSNDAILSWATTNNLAFDHFDIQRSADGSTWSRIGQTTANDNNASQNNYSFVDYAPLNGSDYYRIASITLNGQYFYSEVKLLQFGSGGQWSVSMYPNPVTSGGVVNIQSNEPLQMIRVFDINGKLVMIKNMATGDSQGASHYALNTSNLSTGLYMVQVANSNGTTNSLKLVKKNQ